METLTKPQVMSHVKTLNEFILKHYGNYNIDEVEKGVIPMSFESPPNNVEKKWVNIGTRAGAVKPSTGYAFKNMYQQAQHICENNKLSKRLFKQKNRFKFYDQLLLIILNLWPQKGKFIFERLYKRQSSKYILKFVVGIGKTLNLLLISSKEYADFLTWSFNSIACTLNISA